MTIHPPRPRWLHFAVFLLVLVCGLPASSAPRAQGATGPAVPIKQLDFCTGNYISSYGLGNTLVFTQTCTALGGNPRIVLWRSDGTTAGTEPFMTLPGSSILFAKKVNTTLFLGITVGEGSQLWKTDGTLEGTVLLLNNEDTPNIITSLSPSLVVGDLLYFYIGIYTSDPASYRNELWRSDGTIEGTFFLTNLRLQPAGTEPTITSQVPSGPRPKYPIVARLNNTLLIADGYNLWRSDGTPETTQMVTVLPQGTYIFSSEAINGFVLLIESPDTGQLWKTDGTASGTVPLDVIVEPGVATYLTENLPAVKQQFFFFKAGGIWSSNGTAPCTFQIAEEPISLSTFSEGPSFLLLPIHHTPYELILHLWKIDGTKYGTELVTDFAAPPGSNTAITLQSITHIENDVHLMMLREYIPNPYQSIAYSLWHTDGTAAGTARLQDFSAGDSSISPPILVDGAIYFWTYNWDGTNSTLWKLPRTSLNLKSEATQMPSPEPGTHRMMLPLVVGQC